MKGNSGVERLLRRMKLIGVDLQVTGNFPWLYLAEVNGNKVSERFLSEHGFTVAFLNAPHLTDNAEVFKVIRKYLKNESPV